MCWNAGPPPVQAHFAKVLGAILIPHRSSRYSAATLRRSRGRLNFSGRQSSPVLAEASLSASSIVFLLILGAVDEEQPAQRRAKHHSPVYGDFRDRVRASKLRCLFS